jgi:hypothetical protein
MFTRKSVCLPNRNTKVLVSNNIIGDRYPKSQLNAYQLFLKIEILGFVWKDKSIVATI